MIILIILLLLTGNCFADEPDITECDMYLNGECIEVNSINTKDISNIQFSSGRLLTDNGYTKMVIDHQNFLVEKGYGIQIICPDDQEYIIEHMNKRDITVRCMKENWMDEV